MAEPYKELTKKDKIKFMENLVTMNFAEAGASVGLDRKYKSTSSLRGASHTLYKKLEKEGVVSDEMKKMIRRAVDARRVTPNKVEVMDDSALLNPDDTKGLTIGGKNKALMLIHKKLDRLNKSNKMLDATPLSQLTTAFGTIFDKAQILQGEATENVAVMAKISNDLTPEQALQALMKMREIHQEEKYDKK